MDSAAAIVQESCLGEDEASRTKADDGNVGFIGMLQVSEGFLRMFEALRKLPPDDNEVIEFGIIRKDFVWRTIDSTTRGYWIQSGADNFPVTINLPTEISLVGRVAQTIYKTGKGQQRKLRR